MPCSAPFHGCQARPAPPSESSFAHAAKPPGCPPNNPPQKFCWPHFFDGRRSRSDVWRHFFSRRTVPLVPFFRATRWYTHTPPPQQKPSTKRDAHACLHYTWGTPSGAVCGGGRVGGGGALCLPEAMALPANSAAVRPVGRGIGGRGRAQTARGVRMRCMGPASNIAARLPVFPVCHADVPMLPRSSAETN